ncbi:MAG: hypothetical protein U0R71_05780 [Solirubrobacterales bacterium]
MPAVLLVLVLGLAACGGGGGESDEEKIETTIEAAATSTDPANCAKYSTLNFMEQTSPGQSGDPEKSCEEEAEDAEGQADSVTVSGVEVEGEEASADVAFEGGNLDGQTVTVALVEEGGQWKLNELTGFAKLDAEKLIAALIEQFRAKAAVQDQVLTCVAEGLSELDQSQFEALVIERESQPIAEIAESCE